MQKKKKPILVDLVIIVFSKLYGMTIPVKPSQQYKICMHSIQMSSNYHDVSQRVGDQLIFAQHEQILID